MGVRRVDPPNITQDEVFTWWKHVTSAPGDSGVTGAGGDRTSWDYILVDDAQRIYHAQEWWLDVIKNTDGARTQIIFFASTAIELLVISAPAVPAKVRHVTRPAPLSHSHAHSTD